MHGWSRRLLVKRRTFLAGLAGGMASLGVTPRPTSARSTSTRSGYQIVIPDQEYETSVRDMPLHAAAEFFQSRVMAATGELWPVVRESEHTAGLAVFLGATARAQASGLDVHSLPPESYLARQHDEHLFVAGGIADDRTDTATLFGIYAVLEKWFGVRSYFPGPLGCVVPRMNRTGPLPTIALEGRPHFEVRIGGVGHWSAERQREWHPALRFGQREGLVANHTDGKWAALYGSSHPEFFGLRADGARAIEPVPQPGKPNHSYLCYSEPGVLAQFLANIESYRTRGDLKAWTCKPVGNRIPFGPNDVQSLCACSRCLPQQDAERGPRGRGSNLIFGFVAKLAAAARAFDRDLQIWSLAYDTYQLPPTRVELPCNVCITLCMLPPLSMMNQPNIAAHNNEVIEGWLKLLGGDRRRLIIWDYYSRPNRSFTAPVEFPEQLADTIESLQTRALGIFNNGFNPDSESESAHLLLTYRMVWLTHQLLWNPKADLAALKRQYARDLYGAAALPHMSRFFELLDQRWQSTVWSRIPKFEQVVVDSNSIYAETYSKRVTTELRRALEAGLHASPPGSMARRRLQYFAKRAYQPFFDKAAEFRRVKGRV
jgi:hypothetical protein